MRLGELVQGVDGLKTSADLAVGVTSLAYDSRRVQPGTLFFAIPGEKVDGHEFIAPALKAGAVAVVGERDAPEALAARWVRVPRIRRALATVARTFYGDPNSRLKLIGITGTNGKTTTSYLLQSVLQAAGISSGLFGTIEHRFADRTLPALNTTPESLDLLSYFAELVAAGGQAAVMEASSHALAQERIWGFRFSAAIFTNLTRDHLDYHQDFESYFKAKRTLFEGLGGPPPELAVINADDPWSARLLDLPYPRRITYGLKPDAEVKVRHFAESQAGLEAILAVPSGKLEVKSPLLGRANLYNILAATATALGCGITADKIQAGIQSLASVPGRFERIDGGQPFLVVVDYAHTDDALRNVLATARELTRGKLIVVFGCGGDRDRTKRPLMGEVAGSLADLAVLTSDNPRSEDPLLIMNDVVVLAGKGHETYQVLKDRTIPFDDREVARRILGDIGFGQAVANEPETKSARR